MVNFLVILMICLDLGTYGEVFPIQEEDLLNILQERLKKARLGGKITEVFVDSIENPKGNLYPKAKHARSFEFDPSLSLAQDIKDHHGNILLSKGTLVNPLEITSLSKDLLFFDGNDPLQVAWAKQEKGMWILTNGKPLELEEQEATPVYFDQAGYLASKLGIASIPARVSQKDKKLLIEEVPCF